MGAELCEGWQVHDHGQWSGRRARHFTSTSRIYLSNEVGPAACPQFGVYAWKRAGKRLTFTKISDSCAGRAVVLGLPFTATG